MDKKALDKFPRRSLMWKLKLKREGRIYENTEED